MQQAPIKTLEEVRDLLRERAGVERLASRPDRAAAYLATAREFAPKDPDLVIGQAQALQMAGRSEEAVAILAQALADAVVSAQQVTSAVADGTLSAESLEASAGARTFVSGERPSGTSR